MAVAHALPACQRPGAVADTYQICFSIHLTAHLAENMHDASFQVDHGTQRDAHYPFKQFVRPVHSLALFRTDSPNEGELPQFQWLGVSPKTTKDQPKRAGFSAGASPSGRAKFAAAVT